MLLLACDYEIGQPVFLKAINHFVHVGTGEVRRQVFSVVAPSRTPHRRTRRVKPTGGVRQERFGEIGDKPLYVGGGSCAIEGHRGFGSPTGDQRPQQYEQRSPTRAGGYGSRKSRTRVYEGVQSTAYSGVGGFRREVQPRRQHWFLNEKSGFPFRTPAFCSVSRGQRRLGEKEYRAFSDARGCTWPEAGLACRRAIRSGRRNA